MTTVRASLAPPVFMGSRLRGNDADRPIAILRSPLASRRPQHRPAVREEARAAGNPTQRHLSLSVRSRRVNLLKTGVICVQGVPSPERCAGLSFGWFEWIIGVGDRHRREMARLSKSSAACSNIVPIVWCVRSGARISNGPDNDPLRSLVADKPQRGANARIPLPRPELAASFLQPLTRHLHRAGLPLPIRHFDQFISYQRWGFDLLTRARIYQPPACTIGRPLA